MVISTRPVQWVTTRLPVGHKGLWHWPLTDKTLLEATRLFLTTDISFRPTAITGCTSVTDGQMDGRTDHATAASVAMPPNNVSCI